MIFLVFNKIKCLFLVYNVTERNGVSFVWHVHTYRYSVVSAIIMTRSVLRNTQRWRAAEYYSAYLLFTAIGTEWYSQPTHSDV